MVVTLARLNWLHHLDLEHSMGFGTDQQLGNRTGLAELFGGNIGAPQQLGTTQQPNQLFTLLQSLLGGQQGGGQINPIGGPSPIPGGTPPGGTPLSAIGAQPPQGFGGPNQIMPGSQPPTMGAPPGIGGGGMAGFGGTGMDTGLSNPFFSLINQRFAR